VSANLAPLLSSVRMDWGTPRDLYAYLDGIFRFDLDAATDPTNPLGAPWSYSANALTLPWARSTFLNPPYGRELPKWVAKARAEAADGNTVVCLLPARPDTRWWTHCVEAGEITYIQGRLRFHGAPASAPFPSAIVVFRPRLPERMPCRKFDPRSTRDTEGA
jgi:phage N-6-adenine-methyltransferase